jgi:carboxymethylenebutenolidase
MCHDTDARPPAPPADVLPEPREIDSTGNLRLASADGTRIAAYEALPVGEPRARVVVLPDVRGLHPYYRALAERLAEAGTARRRDRLLRADRARRAPGRRLRVQAARPAGDSATRDGRRGRRRPAPLADGTRPVFTLGFCFGAATRGASQLPASAWPARSAFYGRPGLVEEAVARRGPARRRCSCSSRAPTTPSPVEDVLAAADRLRSAGAEVTTHVFDGAPHSFFDRSFAEHAKDCDEAWRLLLGFVERHARRVIAGRLTPPRSRVPH